MIASLFDICECGDYRHQHNENWATCRICGESRTGGSPTPCRQFRLHQQMVPAWKVVR